MTRVDSGLIPPLIWPSQLEPDPQCARHHVHCPEQVVVSVSDECNGVLNFVELHCLSRVPTVRAGGSQMNITRPDALEQAARQLRPGNDA